MIKIIKAEPNKINANVVLEMQKSVPIQNILSSVFFSSNTRFGSNVEHLPLEQNSADMIFVELSHLFMSPIRMAILNSFFLSNCNLASFKKISSSLSLLIQYTFSKEAVLSRP